jgi:pyridoxine 4-dehydrogenase
MAPSIAGGTLKLADDLTISRMGYGAMQLAGPGVFGPPRDRSEAIAVLREAINLGVTHIDTSDYYGPFVVNEIIKEALFPYPANLCIVTKVGARRGDDASWIPDLSRQGLTDAVHDNINRLGVDALDVVNLRVGGLGIPTDEPLGEQFSVLAELQGQGLIRHLGVSNVTTGQLSEVQAIGPVVTVQNAFNVVNRHDDELVERCARENIAFTPFFPLGGFTPLQSSVLERVATRVEASPQQVALAWLLQHSPAIALIPGTSSVAHLRENVDAASLVLPSDAVRELNSIG